MLPVALMRHLLILIVETYVVSLKSPSTMVGGGVGVMLLVSVLMTFSLPMSSSVSLRLPAERVAWVCDTGNKPDGLPS